MVARKIRRPPCSPASGCGGLEHGIGGRSEGHWRESRRTWVVKPASHCDGLEWRKSERAHKHVFQNFGVDNKGDGRVPLPTMRKTERELDMEAT